MTLDPRTLLVVNVANLLVLASILPVMMGRSLSPAARAARRALVMQGAGWLSLTLSGFWTGQWPDWLLSTVSMGCLSTSQWLMFQSLQAWLGPRPLARTMTVLAVAMPLGYTLSFGSYPVRVGWSNLLIAAQLLVVARATLFPHTALGGRWRWVMLGNLLVMAGLTATRGVLGAWFTELYPYYTAPNPFNIAALMAANITLVLTNVTVLVAWHEEADQKLRMEAVTDELTGALNRHGWTGRASGLVAQARRFSQPLAMIAIDLDHFKNINDTRGHDAGDAALKLFGRMLAQSQRGGDLVARLGGEEFGVLLPMSDVAAAHSFDQRLRAALSAAAATELGYPLNYSSGLAVLGVHADSLEGLMARADAALYQAKQLGRGQLAVADRAPEALHA